MAGGGVNKVILIGNLGKDPELRYTPGGQAVCDFSIATNESWSDKNGQKQERTEWHNLVVWAKQAEICKQYLSKGSRIYVEGRLQTRSWDDKEGHKRYKTEIIVTDFMFLGGGNRGGATGGDIEGGFRSSAGGARGGRGGEGPPDDVGGGPPASDGGGGRGPDDDIPF